MTTTGRALRIAAAALLAAGSGVAAGQAPAAQRPSILASPIQAGCKTFNARTCQIVVEPFTINIASGQRLAAFQIQVDGAVVYDWKPDQSNPPSAPTYSPTRVAWGFGVTCNRSHTVSLLGRDTGDGSLYNLGATAPISCPAPVPELAFYSLVPCRLIDTRDASGAPALAANETRTVGTSLKCGVPPTAAALSANLTVTSPTAPGSLTVYPADGTLPVASQLNFSPGITRAGTTIVSLAFDATGFKVRNASAGTVHFIADVNGFFE